MNPVFLAALGGAAAVAALLKMKSDKSPTPAPSTPPAPQASKPAGASAPAPSAPSAPAAPAAPAGNVATALPQPSGELASSVRKLGSTDGSGDGLAWAATLPSSPGPARDNAILEAVKSGMARSEWVEIPVEVEGKKIAIPVMARTLRIGQTNPVRVSTNYETAQKIAEFLGAAMMTPHVADLTRLFSANALPALPQNKWVQDGSMAKTNRMIEYSQMLDTKVPQDSRDLTSNEGKHWVVSARFWTDSDPKKRYPNKRSANYGWWDKGASGKRFIGPMWQTTGLAHDWAHVDYSQQLQFMSQYVTVDGQKMHVGELLKDPKLNVALSDEGPLPSWAHPAFERSTPVASA